jgi:flagellar motor protein MotB
MSNTRSSALYLILLLLLISSCVSQRKVSTTKKELSSVDSVLTDQQRSLQGLQSQTRAKQEQNELDDTAGLRIARYISKTNAEIDSLKADHMIQIGEAVVNKSDWERLLKTLSYARNSSGKISEKITFLTDLINQNTVVKIDQDVLFEPGSYRVSPAIANNIARIFEPAALEIDRFTKKYPDFPLSLVITAKGYADATTISEGSSLYNQLAERMKLSGQATDNKVLNKELSSARAQQVIELFKKFATARAGSQGYIRNILYVYEGKGETLPNPKVTNYTVDDARRRVVYLFWSVFPE